MSLWIVGAGGVGRETLDACVADDREVTGFLDDGLAGSVVRGLPVHSTTADVPVDAYVVGIASPEARRRLTMGLDVRGARPSSVLHPRAVIAPDTVVEAGAILLANAYVSSSVTVGRHCQVHYNATVGHDAVLEDFVTIYPGANVSGSVRLLAGATVGSNAVVLQGRTVGRGGFVGAGAVVTHDVADGAIVVGSPARPMPS